MLITEIFKSIQGEGTHAGLPCIFVRLTGCNLRCTWCDTAYAFHGGTKMTLPEILARVQELAGGTRSAGCQPAFFPHTTAHTPSIPLVEITGGEPLLQPDTPKLMRELLGLGFTVMVETSGERLLTDVPREVIKIVDVKCPDSGEADTFRIENLEKLNPEDEVKFVISSRRDYEFARGFTSQHELIGKVREVLFSPVFADPAGAWPGLEARELANWILSDGLNVRLGLQLHKFIWDPATKGV
jgi:7-carboxy-7-deazaguanine synthase